MNEQLERLDRQADAIAEAQRLQAVEVRYTALCAALEALEPELRAEGVRDRHAVLWADRLAALLKAHQP